MDIFKSGSSLLDSSCALESKNLKFHTIGSFSRLYKHMGSISGLDRLDI